MVNNNVNYSSLGKTMTINGKPNEIVGQMEQVDGTKVYLIRENGTGKMREIFYKMEGVKHNA